ncbi:MAG: M1 family metallopeptidase [Micropepsaceae bacterium]
MNSLLLALALAAADAPGPDFDALAYTVGITPDFAAQTLSGSTELRFRSLSDGLAALSFSANALTITAATLDGEPVGIIATETALTFDLPHPMARGDEAVLTVTYAGTPKRGVTFDGDSVWAAYFACDWMICRQDAPGDKAAITMTISLPRGMTAIGIGAEISVTKLPDGREAHRWESDRPYSAYLYTFAAGRFDAWRDRSGDTRLLVLGRDIAPSQLKARFGTTAAMLAFFQEKAGVPFPRRLYTQVWVPGSEAQEAATFSVIGEAEIGPILAEPQEDWAIAHELAHQWWGNLVTCASWQEFWLNEGLTTFMTAAWKEHAFGRAAYDREMDLFRKRVARAKEKGVDTYLTFPGPYPSLGLKRAIVYSKGALFLDALRMEIGDAAFWRGLALFTRTHAGGTVTSADFQHAMEEAAGRSLAALFDPWVYGR